MDASRLKQIPLFESLNRADLDRVAGWADEVEVDAGRTVIHRGEPAYEFFAILEGTAGVFVREERVATLEAGDFFGEIGVSEHTPRTASVVATSPMRLAVMFERDFHSMQAEMPAVAAQIIEAIETRRPD